MSDEALHTYIFRSFVNLNETLQSFGMVDAFNRNKADFTGVNGANDLYLTAFSQLNDVQITSRNFNSKVKRQRRQIQSENNQNQKNQVLKFERQFLYAIRHNPTGMITYMGRFYDPTISHDQ